MWFISHHNLFPESELAKTGGGGGSGLGGGSGGGGDDDGVVNTLTDICF